MANTGTQNTKYNSGNVPFSSIYVDIYRPNDPQAPNGGATKLGTYRLESLSPTTGSTVTKRPDVDGGPNGWFIIGHDTEGSAVIQRNVTVTPTVENGDYFDVYWKVAVDGTPNAARFVISSPALPIDPGYRKMSCNVIVDTFATGVSPRDPLNGN